MQMIDLSLPGKKTAVYSRMVLTRLKHNNRLAKGEVGIILDHPTVSSRHAMIEVTSTGARIVDLNSTNGTSVNGQPVVTPTALKPSDQIQIGPFNLLFDGRSLTRTRKPEHSPLHVSKVSKRIGTRSNDEMKTILQPSSLTIQPGEFVCVIGPSGSGKSTLMNIMAGRKRPSTGAVRYGSVGLHERFDELKERISYVPQFDVLHETLTLKDALSFAARLRLPQNLHSARRSKIVAAAAKSVGLTEKLDLQIKNLSGGQRKRASLASEILSRPELVFLDEVTSGLDEETDREIMALLRALTREDMTVVCVTHTLANIEAYCDRIVLMAQGGQIAFVGPPSELLERFDIRHLGEVFSAMQEKPELIGIGVEITDGERDDLSNASDIATSPRSKSNTAKGFLRTCQQIGILIERNIKVLAGDRTTLTWAFAQALIIGGMLGYAFSDFGTELIRSASQQALLMLLGFAAFWLGCNGASKEIVSELQIYRRERDVNLSTFAFISAKFIVSAVFISTQILLMMVACGLIADEVPGDNLSQSLVLMTSAVCGVAVGLVISAASSSRDMATTLVPLALVPQLALGGILVPRLPDFAQAFAEVFITIYWVKEAVTRVFLDDVGTVQAFIASKGVIEPLQAQPLRDSYEMILLHTFSFLAIALGYLWWRYRKGDE